MSDRRALLTDREREIVAGDADVSDSYRYQTISRVRARFDRLADDLAALEEHGDLATELRAIVCDAESGHERSVTPVEDTDDRSDPAPTPDATATTDGPESDAGGGSLDVVLSRLDTNDDRRDAVRACVDYLREHETGQRRDFLDAVYPEHPAGYKSEGGWWNKIGKEYLRAVAEDYAPLTPPATEGAHTWRYDDGEV